MAVEELQQIRKEYDVWTKDTYEEELRAKQGDDKKRYYTQHPNLPDINVVIPLDDYDR